jgi:N-acetylglucosaminyldiphosphoundecaprenol N-acetyl-beta-D-mannosaminyltransferase
MEHISASSSVFPSSLPAGRAERLQGDPSDQASRERFQVLGVDIDAVQIPEANLEMQRWIARRENGRYVAVTGMHGIIEARHNPEFRQALTEADLVVADGMPIVWIGRLRGHAMQRRVYGPELMFDFCQQTASNGYRHYFLGGAPGVGEELTRKLRVACPGIEIAGVHSPPFRPTSESEDTAIIDAINLAAPDVLWLGLGTPKQELWIRKHRAKLRVPVMIGVGAAFDFLSKKKRQAPVWMQENGLEWFFRLCQEPGRLWKRYLLGGPEFCFLLALEKLGLVRFE